MMPLNEAAILSIGYGLLRSQSRDCPGKPGSNWLRRHDSKCLGHLPVG